MGATLSTDRGEVGSGPGFTGLAGEQHWGDRELVVSAFSATFDFADLRKNRH